MEVFGEGATVGFLQRGNNNLNYNNHRNVNANENLDNGRGMTLAGFRASVDSLKTYRNIFPRVCDYDNLFLAFLKAKQRKAKKNYVIEFENGLENELYSLQWELLTYTYKPKPLTVFTVRDPKTRKISASNFRDRVVHHAVCNIIEPIFEKRFICDTFANRKGKGTSAVMKRISYFLHKVIGNGRMTSRERESERQISNPIAGFVLKADIRKYFETVNQEVLLSILRKRIKDEDLMRLIGLILANHKTQTPGKGMPLGNLTSQFFANVYLAEFDYFVKHELKAKYYIRYVDDFVILHRSEEQLADWQGKINRFLAEKLKIELHPDKTKIIPLHNSVPLVGFRVFYACKLLKKSNLRKMQRRLFGFRTRFTRGKVTSSHILLSMAGWEGYAKMGNTYHLRQQVRRNVRHILGQTPQQPL